MMPGRRLLPGMFTLFPCARRLAPGWAIAVLALVPLALFRDALLGRSFIPGQDLLNNFIPWRTFLVRELLTGCFPLWDPYSFCGTPFIANLQTAQFYPPDLILCLLFDVPHALHIAMALHLFWFGAGICILAWRQTGAMLPSVVAGLAAMFSHHVIAKVSYGLVPPLYTLAYTPWVLWLALRLFDQPSVGRGVALAVCIAFQVFAGHPQWVLISGYAVFALAAWRLVTRSDYTAFGRHAAALAFVALLAICLTAVHLFPALEIAAYSATRKGGADYAFATIDSVPPAQLLTLVAPFFFGSSTRGTFWLSSSGYHEIGLACGTTVLLLAVFGLVSSPARARNGLTCAALGAALLALGHYTPLYRLPYWLMPGVAYFRVPARWWTLFVIALALLAAHGAQALAYGRLPLRRALICTCIIGAVPLLGLLLLVSFAGVAENALARIQVARMQADGIIAPDVSWQDALQQVEQAVIINRMADAVWALGIAALVALVALVILAVQYPRRPKHCAVALALLLVCEMLPGAVELLPQQPIAVLHNHEFRRSPAVEHVLRHATGRVLIPDRTISIAGRRYHPELFPERTTVFGLRSLRGYNPTILDAYARYIDRLCRRPQGSKPGGLLFIPDPNELDRMLLDRTSAEYVLSYLPPGPGFALERDDNRLGVYRNLQAWPRAVLVDGRRGELVSATAARIVRESCNRVVITCDWSSSAILALLDADYIGWTASIDGAPVPVGRYENVFRQVQVPAGTHTVEFRFRPWSFRVGAVLSGVAWCAVLTVVFSRWRPAQTI